MKFRAYEKTDSAVITSWVKDKESLFKWASDRFGTEFPISADALNENYAPQLAAGKFYPLTMVDDDGAIAGHMIIRCPDADDETTVRFGFVIVNPEFRGKGVGKQMIRLALDFVRTNLKKVRCVTMGAFANNPPAFNCYESVGFTRSGSRVWQNEFGDWQCIELAYLLPDGGNDMTDI